ncbi:MAG: poly(R)-hydroxyalkanoic acid synthase subunit PhaE [Candidatus Sphingomonas colombiensis]|nr:poly(R)-hydroxyalkanoic acid synthase subunit PhaE [Sphingomonas sp.]WEK42687.1 MAG: poly(R)-hydroxyalkanoic acid synthase subunit PhaE [Sphingomonas sp.]
MTNIAGRESLSVAMTITPTDPSAFFREMLGHWEKAVNSFGGDALKSEEFARGMNAATSTIASMQANTHQMMERMLAAANLPSRSDIDDLARRISAIEEALARIESKLGGTPPDLPKPRPGRGRKPPAQPS